MDYDELGGDPENPDLNLLNGLALDERLFRFMKIDKFCDLIGRNVLVLSKPHKWDDPFEDFLSKTTLIDHAGRPTTFHLTHGFFGQCWTTREECDSFWRNYCTLGDGVRIETTAAKLIRAIWEPSNTFMHLQRFIGKIEYLADDELKARYENCLDGCHPLTDTSGRGIAETLLTKRPEFSYECEVRVLVDDRDIDADTKEIQCRPCELIDSVRFAPKMQAALCEALTDWIVKHGFQRSALSRSRLYDPWKLTVGGTGLLP